MAYTPKSKDSAFKPGSCSAVKRNLSFALCESTPISNTTNRSRKRKSLPPITACYAGRKLSDVLENSQEISSENSSFKSVVSPVSGRTSFDSCFEDSHASLKSYSSVHDHSLTSIQSPYIDISFNHEHFKRSSPFEKINETLKLSSSLEKCTLHESDDNYYESQTLPKRCKWDNEVLDCSRKSNSAPGTPQRTESEYESPIKKYHSLEFTPTKGTGVKIGTPERNEILYPQLVEVKPASKPKSPQKLRNELKRVSKPARKRLFTYRDFVYLFTCVKDERIVISKIFSYLNDHDLVNVAKVSVLWKTTLENDKEAFKRYRNHVKIVTISKENIYFNTSSTSIDNFDLNSSCFSAKKANVQSLVPRSPPSSPSRENWMKFNKMARQLTPAQRLIKCLVCSHPAVIEKDIAQCSKASCMYMWCVKCMSGSKTGPDDLICQCTGLRSPPSPFSDRNGLSDISNELSYNATANASSGYFSQSDVEKSPNFLQNSFGQSSKGKNAVLTDCNKNFNLSADKKVSNNNNNSILRRSFTYQRVKQNLNKAKDSEPGSPPKVKVHAIGSKQSKKNLRRLLF